MIPRAFVFCAVLAALGWRTVPQHQQTPQVVSPADSVAILARVIEAEQRFFAEWRAEWLVWPPAPSQRHYQMALDEIGSARIASRMHCNRYGPWLGALRQSATLIPSAGSARSMCPSWSLYVGDSRPDMSVVIDSALGERARDVIGRARDTLISLIDSASRALPGDGWLSGQHVRLLLDQAYRDPAYFDRALAAARACHAERWWCSSLVGLALYRHGAVALADSVFVSAAAEVPAVSRCSWLDVRALLDTAGRRAYAALPCDQREALAARIWWLADPLWGSAGNERRAEQFSRQMTLILRSTLPKDERFNWPADMGGDAVREMVLRYGWPADMLWGGPGQDRGGDRYVDQHASLPSPPYTTAEYRPGGLHVIPRWSAIADPFTASNSDWRIQPPDSMRVPQVPLGKNGLFDQTQEFRSAFSRMLAWWPAEHFTRRRELIQLPDGQVAMLRRDSTVLASVASELPAALFASANGSAARVTLLSSSRPDTIARIADGVAPVSERVALHADIRALSTLLSLEVESVDPRGPDARWRFGVTPPEPLRAMRMGDRAISDPVLLEAIGNDAVISSDPEEALKSMRGSTKLHGVRYLGIYWETYGFAANDSLELTVRLTRQTRPGVWELAGIALRLRDDPRGSSELRWTEPQPGHGASTFGSAVPIQGRRIVLDITTLQPGMYWLEVAAGKLRETTVVGRRAFAVE